jgi:hypothetical protein
MQTFVVRVWAGAQPPPRELDSLRGVVEHLGSGLRGTFTDDDELLAFLRERRWQGEREHAGEGERREAARSEGGSSSSPTRRSVS